MPRPNILPTIDWSGVLEQGKQYRDWLATAEFPENAAQIDAARAALTVPAEDAVRLRAVKRTVHCVAFAEDWCGDVVRHVPALEKIAEECPSLRTSYLQRSDRPDVFVRFLTNGGEAVPKFVFLSADLVECGSWGPMPERCRELIARGKACKDVAAARKKVSELYRSDSALADVFRELVRLVEIASSEAP